MSGRFTPTTPMTPCSRTTHEREMDEMTEIKIDLTNSEFLLLKVRGVDFSGVPRGSLRELMVS